MSQERICEILHEMMPREGMKEDVVKGLDLFRIDRSSGRSPMNYEPSVIIIAQGQKRAFLGETSILYNPMQYLVLSVPMPLECETVTPDGKPLLGLRIHVDSAVVSDISLAMDALPTVGKIPPLAICAASMEASMTDALCRLLETVRSPLESQFLAPMYIREILFRVMLSDDGAALRMLAYRNHSYFRIVRLIEKIHQFYDQKYEVESMAKEVDMSVSSFHSAFKAITSVSPLQYVKKEKLYKARELMMQEGITASLAAYQVGYESPSQFSREYKRLFGVTPASDAAPDGFQSVI